ncbi:MAG TPA: HIT domain-containing protein [Candidatus Acidoferrum sp.]|nr:HIT domain-containing protein [Candidatus Acidoferrum sp.]
MKDCIFCKIVEGAAPSYKIYEDNDHIGMLDIFPNIRGQSLVIPKKHTQSYIFDVDDRELEGFMMVVKKVAKILQKGLKAGRVNLAFEGYGVDHLHAKLYPAIGTDKGFMEILAKEEVYFEAYPGYLTTLMGPRAKDEELKKIQKEITKE